MLIILIDYVIVDQSIHNYRLVSEGDIYVDMMICHRSRAKLCTGLNVLNTRHSVNLYLQLNLRSICCHVWWRRASYKLLSLQVNFICGKSSYPAGKYTITAVNSVGNNIIISVGWMWPVWMKGIKLTQFPTMNMLFRHYSLLLKLSIFLSLKNSNDCVTSSYWPPDLSTFHVR